MTDTDRSAPASTSQPDYTRFERDPDARAWARQKIQHEMERCRRHAERAEAGGRSEQAEAWRRLAAHMRRAFVGGTGFRLAAFDERLPDYLDTGPSVQEATANDARWWNGEKHGE